MSETTILNYELGYMPIAYDKAKRLAKALEIDEKLLFDDYCRFLDYPFQLRCKELRSELGLTYGTWECAASDLAVSRFRNSQLLLLPKEKR